MQTTLFDIAEPEISPTLPLEERFRLWIARQSGIYCEICLEIERITKGNRRVSIAEVFDTLSEQPDLARSFSPAAGFDRAFAEPMRAMILGFGDADGEVLK